jgi:hypothetical protein
LNIVERLIFRYGDCYYAFDSLLPSQTQSNHKRVSHFRLERWLKKGIELVTYGKDHEFPDTLEQYLEDIPVTDLIALREHYTRFRRGGDNIGRCLEFKDVILNQEFYKKRNIS